MKYLVLTVLTTLVLAQHDMSAMGNTPVINAMTSDVVTVFSNFSGQAGLALATHIEFPTNVMPMGNNQYWHGEFRVTNYNVTGWQAGANTITVGLSWASNSLTDGVLCTAVVTFNSSSDTLNCIDTYSTVNSNRPDFTPDVIFNDIKFSKEKSFTYYTTVGNQRFANFTGHFIRVFATNSSTDDITIANDKSLVGFAMLGHR